MLTACDEHVCDATIPVCTCGHVWEYRVEDKYGVRYTSALVVTRFRALYGEPQGTTRFVPARGV
jgi:hypothetical protein